MDKQLEKDMQVIIDDLEKNYKNKLVDEKKKILEQVIKMYPILTKNKEFIFKKLLKTTPPNDDNITFDKEIVVEQVIHNGVEYYRDVAGGIWNSTTKLVGISDESGNIMLFEDNKHKSI